MRKQDPDVFDSVEMETAGDIDETYIAPDQPMGVHSFGTTAAEERAGETFDQRTRHTNPDIDVDSVGDAGDSIGRIVQPGDEDVDRIDNEAAAVGWIEGDDSDLSAEEAAMHTVEDPS